MRETKATTYAVIKVRRQPWRGKGLHVWFGGSEAVDRRPQPRSTQQRRAINDSGTFAQSRLEHMLFFHDDNKGGRFLLTSGEKNAKSQDVQY
ncbi:hypothetical protein [Paraburkholderia tuberum]|uniref:hypothetical protein n=1 Tax=Paraburkholderia tuberum TaxID=157910 RepID=UPI00115FB5DF|nr:hypothetical protein [Paraburkholderia tuberum]